MGDKASASPQEPPAGVQPASAPEGIWRNAAFALVAQLTTAAFTAVVTLYLVRALGPDDFGVLALALGLAGLARIVATFGIPSATARFLANARDDDVACAALLRGGLRLTVTIATLMGAALALAAGPIAAAYDNEDLVWPLRCLAVALLAEAVLSLYLRAFSALARMRLNARVVFLESAAEAAATIALVAAGTGAVGASLGRAAGYGFGAAVAIVIVLRLYGRLAVISRRRAATPRSQSSDRILRDALPLFAIDGLYGLYSRIDVLVIGAILSTTAVGLFSAPVRMAAPLANLGLAAASSVSPRQAAADPGERRVDAFVAALRWLVLAQAILIAPLLVWAEPIVELLLGSEYDESVNVLRALVPFVFLAGISPLVSNTATYIGRARSRIPVLVAALAVNLVIDVTLLPVIGVVAAGIGTSVAYCLYVPAHVRICRQELGFSVRPLVMAVARALLAAAAMGAVLYLLGGTASLTFAEDALAGLLGLVAYAGSLVVTGEITRRELRHGGTRILAFAGRARRH